MNRPTDEQLLAKAQKHHREASLALSRGEIHVTGMPGEITMPGVQQILAGYLRQLDRNEALLAASEHAWRLPDDVSGPWLLFTGADYYPGGGWHDHVGTFPTWGEVVTRVHVSKGDWAQAVHDHELVAEWRREYVEPVIDEVPRQSVWIRGDDR